MAYLRLQKHLPFKSLQINYSPNIEHCTDWATDTVLYKQQTH
jgi:hypothetical protein